ncbi:TPA: HAD family hydrolase, partial [Staphylococcus aureus]|nr:HAD family hydrolase [Staphylococcus aureus]
LSQKGFQIGVIANGKSKIKQFRLHSLGLMHVINYLSTSETVGFRKPHPKIFEDMIDQLGVLPEQIMYVGDDALNDVAPARAMGMVSVWYKQEDAEIEPLEEEVDFTITTVEELLTILPIKNDNKGENYGSIY